MKKIEHPEQILPGRLEAIEAVRKQYEHYDAPSSLTEDEFFMDAALALAKIAADGGEVPVGAVVVRDRTILSLAANGREVYRDATYHAECAAISDACRFLGGWRLIGCTLYVTLEPCPMCAGAIWNARLPRVVIGAKDARSGSLGSVMDLNAYPLNHKPEITFGVREEACRNVLQEFFRSRR